MLALFAKIKGWAIGAGALVVAISALVLYLVGLGKKAEKADNLQREVEQQDEFLDQITVATEAGDSARRANADSDRLRESDGYKRTKPSPRS